MDKFMIISKIRSLPLPPVKNILNVAVQTARQTMPDKPNKGDYTEPNGLPFASAKPQNINIPNETHSAQPTINHHELNPFSSLNPFSQTENTMEVHGHECTSFMGDSDQGYQRSENYLNRLVNLKIK